VPLQMNAIYGYVCADVIYIYIYIYIYIHIYIIYIYQRRGSAVGERMLERNSGTTVPLVSRMNSYPRQEGDRQE
jgi:hypothetical protein